MKNEHLWLFVDDGKGNKTGHAQNPQSVFLRSFDIRNPKTKRFLKLLRTSTQNGTSHPSESGSTGGLASSEAFYETFQMLQLVDSMLFTFVRIEDQIDSEISKIHHPLKKIIADEVQEQWPLQNRQTKFLLWAIDLTIFTIYKKQKYKRITIVMDRMDFMEKFIKKQPLDKKTGLRRVNSFSLRDGCEVNILSCRSKKEIKNIDFKSFLSLVDTELWMWNRLQYFVPMGFNQSLIDTARQYRTGEILEDQILSNLKKIFSDIEKQQESAFSHAKIKNLKHYLNFLSICISDKKEYFVNGQLVWDCTSK